MKRFLLALLLFATPLFASAQQPNIGVELLASAARTDTQVNSRDILNTNYRGGHVLINVTAYTSGNYTPKIQGKDPTSGTYYDILVGTAISATGITVLKVYPGIAPVVNGAASDVLPTTWRVQVNGAASPSMTFSVSFNADM